MRTFYNWYHSSAHYLGTVVLFFILLWAIQKTFFTASCALAAWKCEHSFGADFMVNLIKSDKPIDMVLKPTTSKPKTESQ